MEGDFERRTRQHSLDAAQIGNRLISRRSRLISDREGPQAPQPSLRLLFAKSGGRGLLETIRPAAPGIGELLFERRVVDGRHMTPGRADDELETRQRRFVEVDIRG